MTVEELLKLADDVGSERAEIFAAAETRFAEGSDVEVRGAFVLDAEGNPTSERDGHAGLTETEVGRLAELANDEAMLAGRVERARVLEAAAVAGSSVRGIADFQVAPINRTDDPHDFERAKTARGADLRGQAMAALEASAGTDDARSQIEQKIATVRRERPSAVADVERYAIATSSDTYRQAFSKLLSNRGHMLSESERASISYADEARAAITIATGLSFPIDIDPSFVHSGARAVNPMRRLANVKTGTESVHKVNVFGAATMAMAADGAEAGDGTPADSTVSIAAQLMQGMLVYSISSAADLDGLVAELGASASDAINVVESDQFTNGTGTAPEIEGILDATHITRVTTGTADTFKEVDLHSVYAGLGVRYRPNATWQTSGPGHLDLSLLENGGGFRINVTDGGMDQDGTLLGKPWYENSELPGPSAPTVWTTDDVPAIFGDIKQAFTIYDVLGTTVEMVPHLTGTSANMPNGTRGLYIRRRLGSGITDTAAAVCVKIG